MAQVIIYQNPNGPNVCVCTPSGEIPIEDVLIQNCPPDAIIVDDSTLPQGNDIEFFNAWVLNGSTVTVDIPTAQAEYLVTFNNAAGKAAQTRQLNTLSGIPNNPNDATWLNAVNANRGLISIATTTNELLSIPLPTPTTGANP